MLSADDLWVIVSSTLVCTGVVTLLTLVALRLNRRGSIASQVAIVVGSAILSIVASTVAVVAEMFISAHDLVVVCWVVAIASLTSAGVAWFILRRTVRRSTAGLLDAARRIGAGDVVERTPDEWSEFDELSSELADTSRRLAEARGELARQDAARRQFFAWVSHDLRTPLAGIRAMSEALEDGLVADPATYISLIRAKVDTVNSMVDDLFELSKLQSTTSAVRPEPVTLLDVISDAVADVQPAAAARGITIAHEGVDGRQVHADPRELTRAIGNLLGNAIRFAPPDSEILISARAHEDGRLVLGVLDRGDGVATEDLGRIFDVGWRADAARTSDERLPGISGAGLGLAIVRGIAEAHGGGVRAQNLPGGFRLDMILPGPAPQSAIR